MFMWLKKRAAIGLPKMPNLSKPGGFVACIMLAFLVTTAVPAEAFGQRGGSRSRSVSKPKSQPKKTTSSNKNKNWNKDSKKSDKATTGNNRNSGWGSKRGSTQPRMTKAEAKQKTAAEKALHDRAKKNGTHFNDRKSATDAFKKNKGAEISQKYPTKFNSEPSTRPDYIPRSTTVGGNTYNVTYNQSHGGYGYMDALGTFIVYDMLTDAAFMNTQMRQYGYAYGQPQVYHASGGGFGIIGILLTLVGVIVVVVIIVAIVKSSG
jgi:hypothetical protein